MTKHAESHFQKILLIDTTSRDQTRLGLIDHREVVTLERAARAQELQTMIAELLEKTNTKLADLDAIATLTGPGSFTGARIGISATNTLGWLYKLPLLPIPDIDFEAAITALQQNHLPSAERVILPTA